MKNSEKNLLSKIVNLSIKALTKKYINIETKTKKKETKEIRGI